MRVYVKNLRGEPLMPCSPRKAKILLKEGNAKVICRVPFTIKLTIPTGESKQEVVGGMDTGSKKEGVGFVKGKRSSGFFAISDIDGKLLRSSVNVKHNVLRLTARSTTLIRGDGVE